MTDDLPIRWKVLATLLVFLFGLGLMFAGTVTVVFAPPGDPEGWRLVQCIWMAGGGIIIAMIGIIVVCFSGFLAWSICAESLGDPNER